MKFRALISPTINQATDIAIDEIVKKMRDPFSKTLIISPENNTLAIEEQVAKACGKDAFISVSVKTFSRLYQNYRTNNLHPLSKEMGVMLVRKLIQNNIQKLNCFNKSCKTIGFAEKIYETIVQMKNSCVSPMDIQFNDESATAIKMKDILFLFNEYENAVKDKYEDMQDRLSALANRILEVDDCKNLDIYILGFDTITKNATAVVKSMVSLAKSVTVGCSKLNTSNSYVNESEVYLTACAIANELNIPIECNEKEKFPCELSKHISSNLFAFKPELRDFDRQVRLFECENIECETSMVLSDIVQKVRCGDRFKDCAICTSNVSDYAKTIERLAIELNVPIFVDSGMSLFSHTFVRFLLSVIRIKQRYYDSQDMIAYCKNVFSAIDPSAGFHFENYINKFAINHGAFTKEFELGKSHGENVQFEFAENVRSNIYNQTAKFVKSECKTYGDFISQLKTFCNDCKASDNLKVFASIQSQDLKYAKVTLQVYEKLMQLFDGLNEMLGSEIVTIQEFYEVLESGTASCIINVVPTSVDTVSVVNLSTSKHIHVKNLYIIGASEGKMPVMRDDCGIISDKEISEISNSFQSKIEPTIQTLNKREKLKLFELLQTANNIVISYPLNENSSRNKPANIFKSISKIMQQNDNMLVIQKYTKDKSLTSFNVKMAENSLLLEASLRKKGLKTMSAQDFNLLYYAIGDKMTAATKRIIERINQTEQNPPVLYAKQLFFANNTTSISQLEDYFSCPYKHFVEYGLKVRENEIAKMKSMDIGNFLHKFLELFADDVIKKNESLSQDELKEEIKSILTKVFEEEKYQTDINKLLLKTITNEAYRVAMAVMYQQENSLFRQTDAEVVFGEGGRYNAISFDKTDIKLAGKIDRIDKWGKNIRLLDYKTGQIDLNAGQLYHGKKIQLFIYLSAVKSKECKEVGAFYFPIKNTFSKENSSNVFAQYRLQGYFTDEPDIIQAMDTGLSYENSKSSIINAGISTSKENVSSGKFVIKQQKHILKPEQLDKLTKYACSLAENAIVEIESGYILPSPIEKGDNSSCDYCKYFGVCGIDKCEEMRRKQLDGIDLSNVAEVIK